MFDESTSAVDTKTESIIYQLLNDLHIWFVTISHRPSLIQYHKKELKLYSSNQQNDLYVYNEIEFSMNKNVTLIKIDENIIDERQLPNCNNITGGYIEINKSGNLFKEIKDIWKLIHLPFGSDHKILRIQVFKLFFCKGKRNFCFFRL